MDILEEYQDIKIRLGEKIDYKEYYEIKQYLNENPNILLAEIYNDLNKKEEFNNWRLDNAIKNRKVFATVYKDNQMQIDYLKIRHGKWGYMNNGFIYNKEQLFSTLEEAKASLKTYRKGYIYTENTEKYIKSNFIDKKEMLKTLYGRSGLREIWYSQIEELEKENNIEKIYKINEQVLEKSWYLIKDKNDNRYLLRFDVENFEEEFDIDKYATYKEYEELEQNSLTIFQYDPNTKKKYNEMIFNYLIEFKNAVKEEYFKLNLNRNQIVERFIRDNEDLIYYTTESYINSDCELKYDDNLFKCFITSIENDIKDRIKLEINKLDFSSNNYYITEDNYEEFINEFTKKAIYSHIEIELISDLKDIYFEEEVIVEDDNKINLYFANAEYLFEIPKENGEIYFDGYITIDLSNNTVQVDIVGITDNDERYYHTYKPTQKDTEILIKASEEYSQEHEHKSLEEILKETTEEEVNEQ